MIIECRFCGAEVVLGEKCLYCGRVAEYHYYGIRNPKTIEEIERRKRRLADGIYTVKSGDSLWKISKAFYGDGAITTE